MEGEPLWKPLSTFFVEYREGDLLGHLLAYFSQSPYLVAPFIIGYWFRARDLHSVCLSFGLLLCVATNWILKNTLKHPRPPGHNHLKTHGMPSDHAQFMAFLAAYVCGMIVVRCRPLRSRLTLFSYVLAVLGVWTLAFLTCWSRVYLGYHYVEQVAIGCVVGAALAFGWLLFVLTALEPYFATFASWPLVNLVLDPQLTVKH